MKQVSERPPTATHKPGPPRQHAKAGKTRKERMIVLGPFFSCVFLCVIFGVFFQFPAPGSAGAAFFALALAASVLWIAAAGLALALDRAIRQFHFMHQDPTPGDEAGKDWDTQSGSFAWMRDWEDLQFEDDHHH